MIKLWVFVMTALATLLTSSMPAAEVLHLNIAGDPDTLDPRTSNNINASFIIGMLFQGLTEVGEDGTASLTLADRVDISQDGLTYTFHLKKTKWSDGVDLTADDFVYAWKSVLDPATLAPCANLLYPIKNAEKAARGEIAPEAIGVKAQDPLTFVVTLEKPVPFFLDLIAASVFFPVPKHKVEKIEKWGSSSDLVVNGPFAPVSWAHFDAIQVKKNPHYWDANRVKLDEIQISMVGDETTALNLFEQGKIDWIGGDFSPLPLDALDALRERHTLHSVNYGGTRYCALNTHAFPFDNLALRRAFSIATNRQALIDHVTISDDEVATNVIASAFQKREKRSLFPDGDVKLARRYLKQALKELKMKPEELKITFKYENAEVSHRLAQALQQQWKDILGITVTLEPGELKTFVSSLRKRDFQMGLIYWMVHYNSPMDILDRYRSKDLLKNYPGWESKEYTRLLDAYFAELQEAKQVEHLRNAEKLFIDDMPVIPLFHFSRPYLCHPALKNLRVTPIGDVFFTEAYWEKRPAS